MVSFPFDSMWLRLDRKEKRGLAKFVSLTRDKKGEFRRGTAVLMLSGKRRRRRCGRQATTRGGTSS